MIGFLCYSSVKPQLRTAMLRIPNRMELTSPTEFAKQKVLSVQEYTFLAARSVANLFRSPFISPIWSSRPT